MKVISIKNISKQYRLGEFNTGTISHDLNRWWKRLLKKEDPYAIVGDENDRTTKTENNYVFALKDISFEVEKGDVIGIVGKNGAGKSTLLKILSKVTGPSEGEINTKGRIASLLEVGTGFHAEMTGRENIYMNGTIMGMSKTEIDSKLEEIVEFAGVEKYLDTPVKRYSSGMVVRLGFSVAAHLDPDILVVDEVLAVGDVDFQKKAIGKMKEVSNKSQRTVLFVSHNLNSLRKLCNKGILLENGKCVFKGTIDDVISRYISSSEDNLLTHIYKGINKKEFPLFLSKAYLFKDNPSKEIDFFENTEDINISLQISVNFNPKEELYGVIEVYNSFGETMIFSDTFDVKFDLNFLKQVSETKLILSIPKQILKVGEYVIFIHFGKWRSASFRSGISEKILKFTVIDSHSRRMASRPSIMGLLVPWKIMKNN